MSENIIKTSGVLILTKDTEIAGRIVPKGTKVQVTKDYGRKLIREGKARDENFIEKIEKKIIKKKHGNN
jgi:23S rRNA-/tRNA-specific pseudouridylate synthase